MDTRFYNFTQTIRDVKRAEHTQQRFSKEVTGVGKTQDQVSIAGSKPDAMKIIKPTYARPVGFSGEVPLGSARGCQISASADAPKQKNDGLRKTFPKVFTDRIERPPDGLFSTKAIQSLGPRQNKEQTPVSMSVPPIRLPGQKLFPMNKRELVTSWRKLMSQHDRARTMGIGSAPSAEKSGLAPAAPPPAPPAVGAPIAARPPSPMAAPAASPPATPKVVLRPRLKAAASGDGGDKATSPRQPVVAKERKKRKRKRRSKPC